MTFEVKLNVIVKGYGTATTCMLDCQQMPAHCFRMKTCKLCIIQRYAIVSGQCSANMYVTLSKVYLNFIQLNVGDMLGFCWPLNGGLMCPRA